MQYDKETIEVVTDIKVTVTAEGVVYNKAGVCGSGEGEASYDGDVTIRATNSLAEPVDLSKVET